MNEESARQVNWLLRLLMGLALASIAVFGLRAIADSGFWMHLATGRAMLTGGLPREDIFSFTAAGAPWIIPSWLYDAALYLVHRVGGAGLAVILHAAAATAAFGLLIPVMRRRARPLPIGLALLLCSWAVSYQIGVSPATAALIFPALFLALILRNTPRRRTWPALIVLQILWTNMHAGFWIGPVITALAAVQAWMDRDETDARTPPAAWLILTALLAAATLINPYGIHLHAHLFRHWNGSLYAYTQEWISPFAGQFAHGTPGALIVIMLIVGGIGLLTLKQRLPIVLTVLAVVSVFAAVQTRPPRFLMIAALLSFPFLCLSLQAGADALKDLFKTMSEERLQKARYTTLSLALILTVGTIYAAVSNRYYTASGSAARFGLGVNREMFSTEALDIMRHPDFPERVLNSTPEGGFLLWHMPERKVYIDSRAGVYGEDFYEQWARALSGEADAWKSAVDDRRIDGIVLNCCYSGTGAVLRKMLDRKNWNMVYFDGTTCLLVRSELRYRDLINNADFQKKGLRILQNRFDAYEKAITAGRRPALPARMIGASGVFFSLGRLEQAKPMLELLAQHAPNMATAWMRLGRIYRREERIETAINALERACELAPKNVLCWLWLSDSYAAAGRKREAELAYQRSAKINPAAAKAYGSPAKEE